MGRNRYSAREGHLPEMLGTVMVKIQSFTGRRQLTLGGQNTRRFLSAISAAILTGLAANTTSSASEEARVTLYNKTNQILHLYIDERFMCDAPVAGSCFAEHVTVGSHEFEATGRRVHQTRHPYRGPRCRWVCVDTRRYSRRS